MHLAKAPSLPPSSFPKRCACGREYRLAEWRALPLVSSSFDVIGDGSELLQMRNCACGSTLAIVLGGSGAVAARCAS